MHKKRLFAALWLSLFCLLARSVFAQETWFDQDSALLSILRVRDVQAVGERIETLLRTLNPHNAPREPLQSLIGTSLRNPGLRGVPNTAYMEWLFLQPSLPEAQRIVMAFPIQEAEAYRVILAGNPVLREENTANAITTFREDRRGESPLLLYYSPTATNIALFGGSKGAIEKIRKLYQRTDRNGLLPDLKEDVRFLIQFRRILSLYDSAIHSALAQLSEDIVRDVVGADARANRGLGLGIQNIFSAARDLVTQILLLDLRCTITKDDLQVHTHALLERGKLLRHLLTKVPQRPLRLAGSLPPGVVAFHSMHVWPEYWRPMAERVGESILSSIGGVVGQDVTARLNRFLMLLQMAGPEELASGILAGPAQGTYRKPVSILLVRWKNPKHIDGLLDEMASMLGPGPITELLERNGIKFTLTRERGDKTQTPRIDRLRIHLRPTGEKPLAGFVLQPRHFQIAMVGDVLAVVSNPTPERAADVSVAEAARTEAMRKVLASVTTKGARLEQSAFYQKAFAPVTPQTIGLVAVSPLEYLQLATTATADWRALLGELSVVPPSVEYAQRFQEFVSAHEPAVLLLEAKDNNAVLQLHMPVIVLQELAQAVLGIRRQSASQ